MCKLVPAGTLRLLDIGSGLGRNLQLFSSQFPKIELTGTEIAEAGVRSIRSLGFNADVCDASKSLPYPDGSFEVVTCGEVIEHVVDTDQMLSEIRRVLKPAGRLILTTPNLAYLPNRLLLLFGIQPLFTETSLHSNMGRRWKVLGQGGPTQGHLKVFTAGALRDLVHATGFTIRSFQGYSWLTGGVAGSVDRMLTNIPELAAGFVVYAEPNRAVL